MLTGYLHPAYAGSLESWGRPILLPGSGGSMLVRDIVGEPLRDAIGPYPFFCCRDWQALAQDINLLAEDGLVSVALVTDPFGDHDESLLAETFPDLCLRFKEHFVVDLAIEGPAGSAGHRRNARRALDAIDVEVAPDPVALLDMWCEFYGTLIERHGIAGPQRFSRAIFARQLAVPGMTALVARHGGNPVGITLWYGHGDAAYYHLGAYSPEGYDMRASFALFDTAIRHFRPDLRWLALGAGAGLAAADDGLTRFKRGWSTGTRPAYLCGRILDRAGYARLAARYAETRYFPAYRAGEYR